MAAYHPAGSAISAAAAAGAAAGAADQGDAVSQLGCAVYCGGAVRRPRLPGAAGGRGDGG